MMDNRPDRGGPTDANIAAFEAGQEIARGLRETPVLRWSEQVFGQADSTGAMWLCFPSKGIEVPATLRAALNAFLKGYGVHGEYRFLISHGNDPSVSFNVADKWRTRGLAYDRWVPILPGRLSTQLAFTMFQRGDKPDFATVVEEV